MENDNPMTINIAKLNINPSFSKLKGVTELSMSNYFTITLTEGYRVDFGIVYHLKTRSNIKPLELVGDLQELIVDNLKKYLHGKPSETAPLNSRFTTAISQINKLYNLNPDIDITISILGIMDEEMVLADSGDIRSFHARNGNYNELSIGSEKDSKKLFSNITEGKIIKNDKLLIATPYVIDNTLETELADAICIPNHLETINILADKISELDDLVGKGAAISFWITEGRSASHEEVELEVKLGLLQNLPSIPLPSSISLKNTPLKYLSNINFGKITPLLLSILSSVKKFWQFFIGKLLSKDPASIIILVVILILVIYLF